MLQAPVNSPGLKRLGRYKIVRPLSKGGMALVYEARRETLAGVSPRVAIKLILPQHAGSETFKQLFINEARLGASMQHQNLVQIQDFKAEGDRTYLVMEFVEGLNLRRVMTLCQRHEIQLPLDVILDIGMQCCDGLHYAHTATDDAGRPLSLVHRDIKPSNLMLTPEGVVKVLDFGISKGSLREEREGSVKGTWGYMAPEQANGREVFPSADVFGLAVVLYELAALTPMFPSKDREDIKRLLDDDHPCRMATTLDGPYAPLARVLIRALQRGPKSRYASAESFGRALAKLCTDPIMARERAKQLVDELDELARTGTRSTVSAPQRVEAPAPSMVSTPTDSVEPSGTPWLAWIGGGLAAVAAAGALGFLLYRDMEHRVREVEPSVEVGHVGGERGAPRTVSGAVPGVAPRRTEPAEPAAPAEPVDDAVRVRIDRRPVEAPPPAPEPEAVDGPVREEEVLADDADPGLLVVRSVQRAEVYIDGRFESFAPVSKQLPPGMHTISIVAMDGRKKTIELEVESGKKRKRTWDFDGMKWR